MEVAPGIHRLESYMGKKLMAHHLVTGDRSLLVDVGTPKIAQEELLPWITDILGNLSRLDLILITHADVDHYGGLAVLQAACGHAAILAPMQDRRWIENPETIFAERYDAYRMEHKVSYPLHVTEAMHAMYGPSIPIDLGLRGGEDLRCGPQHLFQVLHVPGHTPGHLMLWEAQTKIALIGDALNGMTQLDRNGIWTAPPPYTDRDLYMQSIQTLEYLNPEMLLTAHYPVMRGKEVATFVEASRNFVLRADVVLTNLLLEADTPLTLAQLIEYTNPLLGPFVSPTDLQYALEAHLSQLEQTHQVLRSHQQGVVTWELVK